MSALIALALALAGPTPQQEKQLGPVKDAPAVQLDRDAAYILLRSPAPVTVNLFRIADPEEQAAYRARRSEALRKAHDKWVKKHATWVRYRKIEDDRGEYGLAGEEPVEPTDANLNFPAIDQENLIGFGPFARFALAQDKVSTYLQRVWPGRYVLYGSIAINPNGGAAGVCACMGTVSFEAKAGHITDVGEMTVIPADFLISPGMRVQSDPALEARIRTGETTMIRLAPPSATRTVDPRLSGYPIVPASFRAAGPVPNYFGVQVDRLTAIPGVLAYERDRIVDVAGAASGASSTGK